MSKKKISLPSMVLFGICSLVVLYTWSASAAKGTHGIGVWIIMFALFLIPNCLAVSELGSSYAEDGGISLWVEKAFGPLAGSVVGWFYWINYVFGLPLVFVTVMSNIQAYFFPHLSSTAQMLGTIGLLWFTVVVGICNSGLTQKLCSWGGNVVAGIAAILGVLAIVFCIKNGGSATPLGVSTWIPSFKTFTDFAPTVVFNLLGFELISSVASNCDNPQKNVPKFTMISGFMVALLYIAATVSILAIIPQAKVDSVNGLVNAISLASSSVFGSASKIITSIVVIGIIYGLLASGIGWAFGTANVISSAGLGEKSAILGHKNKKFGTPDFAYLIVGIAGTLYTISSYSGSSSVNAIYDVIFSFSSILFMAPYLFMYPAVIKLRYCDPNHERPYKIPGGKIGLWLSGILPAICVAFAMVSLSLPKSTTANPLAYELQIWGGFFIIVLIGIGLHFNGIRRAKKAANKTVN